MTSYETFLENKRRVAPEIGFTDAEIKGTKLHPVLFDFEKRCVKLALKRGRSAIFLDCGMGKTLIQLEWARKLIRKKNLSVLIVAPLAVNRQTVKEASKLDMVEHGISYYDMDDPVGAKPGIEKDAFSRMEVIEKYDRNVSIYNSRDGSMNKGGITITNYEQIHKFNPDDFQAIVLDESSILKSYSGKYRQDLTEFAKMIPYRLCCTATPSPNDLIELINHSEFLGVMTGKEVIAMYFKQDGNTTHQWRLKNHAVKDFWEWMASWSVAAQFPSDLGFKNGDFILPEKEIIEHGIRQKKGADGFLFPMPGKTLAEERANRKSSMDERIEKIKEIIAGDPDEQWLIWCQLNQESAAIAKAVNAVEVKGSDSVDHKESSLIGFSNGEVKRLVTKPSIAGFGLNWQNCARVIFFGLDHSYEGYYQAVRRVWRFGQKRKVQIHIIEADTDGPIVDNLRRKEKQWETLMEEITKHMRGEQLKKKRKKHEYQVAKESGEGWELWQGDSIELIKDIKTDSVGLSVFSPPFPGMYVYTDTPRDVGNCGSFDELIDHFGHLVKDLLRITMPGRSCCVHLTQGVAFKWIDGYIGLKDFRGRVIDLMESEGWVYYGEVTIDKNPQVKAIRTKDQGLLFKTLAKDSSNMHMALADYLLQFRKKGDNPEPIRSGVSDRYKNPDGWITSEEWIRWARPVWYCDDWAPDGDGIKETDVLNVNMAKDEQDEKHLCPLQLGVIERAIKLWTNPGDLVFSPFAGIGSEIYEAVRLNRRGLGIELKESYFKAAVHNLQSARHIDGGLLSIMENAND